MLTMHPISQILGLSVTVRLGFALVLLAACTPGGGELPRQNTSSAVEPDEPTLESESDPSGPPGPPIMGLTALAPGVHHTCALERGRVLCWGHNRFDILGVGPGLPKYVTKPHAVVGLDEAGPILQVATDYDFSCALAEDGATYCWGDNDSGQLGVGDLDRRDRPTLVPGVRASALFIGFRQGCALALDHRKVWCWGTGELTPIEMPALAGIEQLANPGGHTCSLRAGAMRCWGHNSGGQIGNGEGGCEYDEPLCDDCRRLPSRTCKHVEQPVAPIGLPEIVEIAASSYSYARDQDGAVWQWGQVGQTTSFAERPNYRPQRVTDLPPVVQISAGSSHACARTLAGEVLCWGHNSFGQLGFENHNIHDSEQPTPTKVEGLPPARAVAAGFHFTCALAGEGEQLQAWCWGDNGSGQLGDGTNERRHAPAPVVARG